MPSSDSVWLENDGTEVRNAKWTTKMGGGKPGDYWTSSVKRAIRNGDIDSDLPTRCKDYDCANSDCERDATLAGHVWLTGYKKVKDIYLVPICSYCNNNRSLRFEITAGTVVIEEQRASVFQKVKSAVHRFIDWYNSSSDDSSDDSSDE